MLISKIMRILRSKITISIVVGIVALYCCVMLIWNQENSPFMEGEFGTFRRPKEFQWVSDLEPANLSNPITTCRNSVQGKVLIADDKGYICNRKDIQGTGCCNGNKENTQRFACETCNDHGCCSIYEYCVSCCLKPSMKEMLQRVLKKVGDYNPLYASVADHFELCLVKCRTSSQSVQHETLYRDPKAKHCYGEGPPPIVNET